MPSEASHIRLPPQPCHNPPRRVRWPRRISPGPGHIIPEHARARPCPRASVHPHPVDQAGPALAVAANSYRNGGLSTGGPLTSPRSVSTLDCGNHLVSSLQTRRPWPRRHSNVVSIRFRTHPRTPHLARPIVSASARWLRTRWRIEACAFAIWSLDLDCVDVSAPTALAPQARSSQQTRQSRWPSTALSCVIEETSLATNSTALTSLHHTIRSRNIQYRSCTPRTQYSGLRSQGPGPQSLSDETQRSSVCGAQLTPPPLHGELLPAASMHLHEARTCRLAGHGTFVSRHAY